MKTTVRSEAIQSAHAEQQFNVQAIFDNIDNAVIAIDRDGIVLMYNPVVEKALRCLGISVGKGLNIFDLLEEDERSFWRSMNDRAMAGEHASVEREYEAPEGKRLIRFVVFPLYAQDVISAACLTAEDITNERQVALALERSEEDHRRLFNENPLPIWIVDRETYDILHVNDATCHLYGYSREEFRYMNVLDVRTPEDIEYFKTVQSHMIRSEIDQIVDARHRKKNGDLILVRLYSHPITFANRPARVALIQDVTAQLQAERSLRSANERFRLAAEAISSIVFDLDLNTMRFTTSSAFKRLTGYDPETHPDVLTRSWWESQMHPQDKERIIVIVREALESRNNNKYEMEYRVRHRNGHYLYVWHSARIMRDESGQPIRVVGSVQDITERKQLEATLHKERNAALLAKEAAEEMSRLKNSFLTNMSHELRTPMTAVLGFSQLISESSNEPEIRAYADSIESSATRLLETLKSVLDLASLEANNVPLRPMDVSVNSVVRDICQHLEPLALQRFIELRFLPSQLERPVVIDVSHLRSIMTNLIGNAIKFTSSGIVTVSTFFGDQAEHPFPIVAGFASYRVGSTPGGDIFSIAVQDTGTGIGENYLATIFEEFKQESIGYNRTHEGSGLGLTISSRLAIAMGGSIEVQSAKGVGSTFIIRLPIIQKRG